MRCKFLSNTRSHGFSADYKRTGLVNFDELILGTRYSRDDNYLVVGD